MHRVSWIGEVVVLCAAAFLCMSCARGLEESPPVLYQSVVSPSGPQGGVHADTTDLGGSVRAPESPCSEDPSQVYRYAARTLGGTARIDDFCVGEGLLGTFMNQPPEEILGECPTEICGMATAARRGPLESALLQSVVSLEHSRVLQMNDMTRMTEETGDALHQVSVGEGTVKFQLAPGVQCVARLEVFEEHVEVGSSLSRSPISVQGNGHEERMRYRYTEGPTISRGSVFMQQTLREGNHQLLAIIESHYEGRSDSELFQEKILCESSGGPISVSESPVYGFRVKRASRDEWMVQAHLRSAAR